MVRLHGRARRERRGDLKLRHVFQHTRESYEGELLSVEAFGVVS